MFSFDVNVKLMYTDSVCSLILIYNLFDYLIYLFGQNMVNKDISLTFI